MKILCRKFVPMFTAGLVSAALTAPLAASAVTRLAPTGPIKAILPIQIIEAKATALGGHAFTGDAVSTGLETIPGGFRLRYQNCDIYLSNSPSIGCHEIDGPIRDKYNYLGGPWSDLGLPATDEQGAIDAPDHHNDFSGGGSIYWTGYTGAMELRGSVLSAWLSQRDVLGYPTVDSDQHFVSTARAPAAVNAVQPIAGSQSGDFQNGVIYIEGGQQKEAVTADLSRNQLTGALRNLLLARLSAFDILGDRLFAGHVHDWWYHVDSVSITGVSATGPGFLQSRNRLVSFHVAGYVEQSTWPDVDFTIDLSLRFFAQKETDGTTSLRVVVDDASWQTHQSFGFDYVRATNEIGDVINGDLSSGAKLIDLNIPSVFNVLSFKTLADGETRLYLQPGPLVPLAALAVQRGFDDLAR